MSTVETLQLGALLGVWAVGACLRIRIYAANSSLFLDECALAVNLQHRHFSALSHTLDYNQAAPLGLLYLLKALTGSLGFSEWTLRLLPLICGLGTIVTFYILTRQILTGWALVAANLLMCVNHGAIEYSAQVKQYSLELMVTVLMLLLSAPLFDPNSRSKVLWINALVLGLLPWFSFSSVFVLAGISLAVVLSEVWAPRKHGVQRTAGVLLLFGVLLIPVYMISIRPGMANPGLHAVWTAQFFPLHALSEAPLWIASKIKEICVLTFGGRFWPLAAIGMLFGLVASILRRSLLFLAGTTGALACLGAAVFQKYPFSGRLILFLMPVSILLVVAGYQWLRSLFSRSLGIIADLIAAFVLLWCVASAVRAYAVRPPTADDPREALRFVARHWQTGDRLYTTQLATPCVIYYGPVLDFPISGAILNVVAVNGAQPGPSALSIPISPGRDWLIEMREPWRKRGEAVPVREYFEARGTQLKRKDVEWTSSTLYQVH
jgi:hypothetical protein